MFEIFIRVLDGSRDIRGFSLWQGVVSLDHSVPVNTLPVRVQSLVKRRHPGFDPSTYEWRFLHWDKKFAEFCDVVPQQNGRWPRIANGEKFEIVFTQIPTEEQTDMTVQPADPHNASVNTLNVPAVNLGAASPKELWPTDAIDDTDGSTKAKAAKEPKNVHSLPPIWRIGLFERITDNVAQCKECREAGESRFKFTTRNQSTTGLTKHFMSKHTNSDYAKKWAMAVNSTETPKTSAKPEEDRTAVERVMTSLGLNPLADSSLSASTPLAKAILRRNGAPVRTTPRVTSTTTIEIPKAQKLADNLQKAGTSVVNTETEVPVDTESKSSDESSVSHDNAEKKNEEDINEALHEETNTETTETTEPNGANVDEIAKDEELMEEDPADSVCNALAAFVRNIPPPPNDDEPMDAEVEEKLSPDMTVGDFTKFRLRFHPVTETQKSDETPKSLKEEFVPRTQAVLDYSEPTHSIWHYFHRVDNGMKAECLICGRMIVRAKSPGVTPTTSAMRSHMQRMHSPYFTALTQAQTVFAEQSKTRKTTRRSATKPRRSSGVTKTRKR